MRKERAFYYVRVLEIPTPRWTAFDAKRYHLTMPQRGPDGAARTRLYFADLVHATGLVAKARVPFEIRGSAPYERNSRGTAGRRLARARPSLSLAERP